MTLLRISLYAFALVTFAVSAQAGPITSVTLDDCDSDGCKGSDLFLSVEDEGGGSWLVTYTINTDGYTGDASGFNQVGFLSVHGWTAAELVAATPGLASWSDPVEAPINANSVCSNSTGNSSKVCSFGFVDIAAGGDYTWKFRLTGGRLLDTADWHLGAQYAPALSATGKAKGDIISASPGPGAAVPEPSAALLFGVGAFVLNGAYRRR